MENRPEPLSPLLGCARPGYLFYMVLILNKIKPNAGKKTLTDKRKKSDKLNLEKPGLEKPDLEKLKSDKLKSDSFRSIFNGT